MQDKNHRNEGGQSILVIAFIVMVLLALVALVVDVGNAYAQRRIVQNAVDAAAMAGALKLSEHDAESADPNDWVTEMEVYQAINEYATANGLATDGWNAWFVDSSGVQSPNPVDQINFKVPDGYDGVEVDGLLPFDTYFAHLIGFEVMEVNAEAPAYVLSGPCGSESLFPVIVNIDYFPNGTPELGVEYGMWGGSPSDNHNSEFWWVHWDPRGSDLPSTSGGAVKQGGSSQALDENIVYTERSGLWHVGDWVQEGPGVMFDSDTKCFIGARIEGYPINDKSEGCKQGNPAITLDPVVTIPIYDARSGDGDDPYPKGCPTDEDPLVCQGESKPLAAYRIVGFARFRLTCYYASKNKYSPDAATCHLCDTEKRDDCMQGIFEGWVTDSFEDGCLDTGIVAPSFRQPSPTMTPLP